MLPIHGHFVETRVARPVLRITCGRAMRHDRRDHAAPPTSRRTRSIPSRFAGRSSTARVIIWRVREASAGGTSGATTSSGTIPTLIYYFEESSRGATNFRRPPEADA
jgi:hypothetical protein